MKINIQDMNKIINIHKLLTKLMLVLKMITLNQYKFKLIEQNINQVLRFKFKNNKIKYNINSVIIF